MFFPNTYNLTIRTCSPEFSERWQLPLVCTDVQRLRAFRLGCCDRSAFNSDRSGDAVGYAVAFVQRRTFGVLCNGETASVQRRTGQPPAVFANKRLRVKRCRWHMCLSVSPIGETGSANRSALPLDDSFGLYNCLYRFIGML